MKSTSIATSIAIMVKTALTLTNKTLEYIIIETQIKEKIVEN